MEAYELLSKALGLSLEPRDLNVLQVCLRGIIVFMAAIVIVRVAHKRFLAKLTAFDAVLGFVLSSALSRAINGSAPFFPTLAMGVILVLLHRALSAITFHSVWLSRWIEGLTDVLVEGGKPKPEKLRRHKISEEDLLEEGRLKGRVTALSQIQTATLERSGEISIIPLKQSQ